MGLLTKKQKAGHCIFCGASGPLSGEHKLKRSLLNIYFDDQVTILSGATNKPKFAQSTKSKHFHFDSPVCQKCNNDRFQLAELYFSQVHEAFLRAALKDGGGEKILQDPTSLISDSQRDGFFRYLSRIMALHIAETNGPIFRTLTQHATSRGNISRIHCRVGFLDECSVSSDRLSIECKGIEGAVAHGGLVVQSLTKGAVPTAFHSYFTFAPFNYAFWIQLHPLERFSLSIWHRDFLRSCKNWEAEDWRLTLNRKKYGL